MKKHLLQAAERGDAEAQFNLGPGQHHARWEGCQDRCSMMAKQIGFGSQTAASRHVRADTRSGRTAPRAAWPQTAIGRCGFACARLRKEGRQPRRVSTQPLRCPPWRHP